MTTILIPALNPSSLCYSIGLAQSLYESPKILIYLDRRRASGPRLKSLTAYIEILLSSGNGLNINAVNSLGDFCCNFIFITDPRHSTVTTFLSDIANFPNSIKNSRIVVIGDIFGIVPPLYTLRGLLRRLYEYIAPSKSKATYYQLFFSLDLITRLSLLDSFSQIIQLLSAYRMNTLPEIPVGCPVHVDIMPALLSPRSIKSRVKKILDLNHSREVFIIFLPHPADYPFFDHEVFNFYSKTMCVCRANEASEVFLACLRQKYDVKVSVSYGSTAVLPAMAANPLLDYVFVPISPEPFFPSAMDVGVISALSRLQRVLVKNIHTYIVSAQFSDDLGRAP